MAERGRDETDLSPEQGARGAFDAVAAAPPWRVEIRPDFPVADRATLVRGLMISLLEAELEKRGTRLAEAGPVHIAYPHKHPRLFPAHRNAAERHVKQVVTRLRAERPDVDWIVAGGLCETVHLDRSSDQSCLHALTGRQHYVMEPGLQDGLLPLPAAPGRTPYFVIVDQCLEQGTTVANMMSFIHNQGGFVLAAFAGRSVLAQARGFANTRRPPVLSGAFNDASRNTARLPDVATALSAAARREGLRVSPDEAIRMLDDKMRAFGHSVFALTNGECDRIGEEVSGRFGAAAGFSGFMAALEGVKAVPPPVVPPVMASMVAPGGDRGAPPPQVS